MKIAMKEAAKAWGEGKEVQWQDARQLWHDMSDNGFVFNRQIAYRLKPEVTTSLSIRQLRDAYYSAYGLPDVTKADDPRMDFNRAVKAVADAAIKQYIKEQEQTK
jgi:pentatricopeptide repeat protein